MSVMCFIIFVVCYVCLLLRWLNECKRCYNRGWMWGGWVFRWCCCPVLWLTQSICLLQTKPFTTTEICYIGYNKRYVYIKLFYDCSFFCTVFFLYYINWLCILRHTRSRILLKNDKSIPQKSKQNESGMYIIGSDVITLSH